MGIACPPAPFRDRASCPVNVVYSGLPLRPSPSCLSLFLLFRSFQFVSHCSWRAVWEEEGAADAFISETGGTS
eukprot:757889-Hanusia_phi.AAC.1